MDSQGLPQEDFSMSRPDDLLYPPPSNSPSNLSGIFPSCKVSEAAALKAMDAGEEAELLDISDSTPTSVDITDREFGPGAASERGDGNGTGNGDVDGNGAGDGNDGGDNSQGDKDGRDLLSQAIHKASSYSQDPVNFQDAGWNIMDSDSSPPELNSGEALVVGNPCRDLVPVVMEDEFHNESSPESCPPSQSQSVASFPPPNQLAGVDAESKMMTQSALSSTHRKPSGDLDRTFSLRGATFIAENSNPLAIRITSAVIRINGFASDSPVCKNEEDGFFQHDFVGTLPDMPPVPLIPDPSPDELGNARFCAVRETAEGKILRTVRREPVISFLLLVRSSDGSLYLPSGPFFDMAMNKMEIHVMTSAPHLLEFSWCASKWRGCGILDLSLEPELEEWRTSLSKLDLNGFRMDTFPLDSLLMGPDVSALLKEAYWTYDLAWFERSLTYRNKTLKGYVRTALSKSYDSHDFTHHGVNMNRWKMVYLAGDCVFMESLSNFPLSYRFRAGPATTALRGGIRKPTFLFEPSRTQFTWTRSPLPPSLPTHPIRDLDPLELGRLTLDSSSSSPSPSSLHAPSRQLSSSSSSSSSSVPKLEKACSLPSDLSLDKPSSPPPIPASFPLKKTVSFKNKPKQKPKYRSERLKAAKAKAKKDCC